MVKIQEAIESGDICRSVPIFCIGGSGAGQLLRRKALREHIDGFFANVNQKDSGLLLYTLPQVLDMRVLVGASGDVYVTCPSYNVKL